MYKYFVFSIVNKNLSLLISIILFSSINIIPQIKNYHGAVYPDNYEIQMEKNLPGFNKQLDDTLNYITFDKIRQDFLVNNGCGNYGADQHSINVTRDDEGNYMCVWIDEKSGLRQINAQLFNASDEKSGNVIRVDEEYNKWNSAPQIAYNYVTNEYIITWAETGYNIRFQRLSKYGEKIGVNTTANQKFNTNTNSPSVAVDNQGNFLITWYSDYPNFGPIIPYFRIFDKNGNAITGQKELITGNYSANSIGSDQRAASDTSGNFIIVWSSYLNNHSLIMMQIINSDGQFISDNIIVSNQNDSAVNTFPGIASTKDGSYLIYWSSDNDLKGRIYNITNGFTAPPFTISDESIGWFTPSASTDEQNNFYVIWFNGKPISQIITKQGVFLGSNKIMNMSTPIIYPSYPKLTNAYNGTLYFTYTGNRKNDVDVMIQKTDLELNPLGSSVKVADDYCTAFQTKPLSKYNKDGKSIVIWNDRRDGRTNLYGQILDKEGNFISDNFLINDTSKYVLPVLPYISTDRDGNFIVSFSAVEKYSPTDLIIQKVSPSGALIDSNRSIKQIYNTSFNSFTGVNANNDLLVCWFDNYGNYSSAYMKKFDANLVGYYGTKEFLKPLYPTKILDISINNNLNTLIMWLQGDKQNPEEKKVIMARVYNDLGNPVSAIITVDSLAEDRSYLDGRCQIDDNDNMAFIWRDYRGFGYDSKINVKRFYPDDGKIIFNTFSVNDIFSKIQIIKFINKKLFIAWTAYKDLNSAYLNDNNLSIVPVKLHIFDPFLYLWGVPNNNYSTSIFKDKLQLSYESIVNPDKGYDIWLNTQKIENIDFDSVVVPKENKLTVETVSSAFPNPNSSSVNLTYKITVPVDVNISVYNILGEKISIVDRGMKEPGTYSVSYDTHKLASGIYFIYYVGMKTYIRKFLIVR